MRNYECMYRALVRRLVEIADADDRGATVVPPLPPEERLVDYDRVARAHEHTVDVWKEMGEA